MAYACICHFFVVPLQPQRLINYMATTRQELIEELKGLLEQDVMAVKEQVDHIKTQFYTAAQEPAEELAAEENETPQQDPLEEQFKQLLAQYKAKRAEVAAVVAKEQADNLARKQAILEKMKTLAEGETDGVMANFTGGMEDHR